MYLLKKIKSQLGFIYRAVIGMIHTLRDNPQIDQKCSTSIGMTLQGREIECYSFGTGEIPVLYFGGIHGNEVGTVKLMRHWVKYLSKNIPEDITAYIIPCLNRDGYEQAQKYPDYLVGGKIGKTNANHVDLNRNFPTSGWKTKSKIFIAGKYESVSAGTGPASEPEISSLLNFIQQKNISRVYSFHNCWSTVFSLTPSKELEDYSKLSGYRIYSQDEWDNLDDDHKQGNMNTWGAENDINVIEVECKSRWGSDWDENKSALVGSLRK